MGQSLSDKGTHKNLKMLFSLDLSKDMAENLVRAFEGRDPDAVLSLQVFDFGVWVVEPTFGMRVFIGSLTPPDHDNVSH